MVFQCFYAMETGGQLETGFPSLVKSTLDPSSCNAINSSSFSYIIAIFA